MSRARWMAGALGCLVLCGCASKPPAEVSQKELTAVRDSHAAAKIGDPKQKVLDSYQSGNKVKLGSSVAEGATIEEWKVEAYHDEKNRKDLFVSFLYFCDDRFVDSSDTRIDFRSNPDLVKQWKAEAH